MKIKKSNLKYQTFAYKKQKKKEKTSENFSEAELKSEFRIMIIGQIASKRLYIVPNVNSLRKIDGYKGVFFFFFC